jgi:hypothetical protein
VGTLVESIHTLAVGARPGRAALAQQDSRRPLSREANASGGAAHLGFGGRGPKNVTEAVDRSHKPVARIVAERRSQLGDYPKRLR